MHNRVTHLKSVSAHVVLCMLLVFCQPVKCIFWPMKMLNWLVAASELHKHRGTGCTAEWPQPPPQALSEPWESIRNLPMRACRGGWSGPTVHSLYCDCSAQSAVSVKPPVLVRFFACDFLGDQQTLKIFLVATDKLVIWTVWRR